MAVLSLTVRVKMKLEQATLNKVVPNVATVPAAHPAKEEPLGSSQENAHAASEANPGRFEHFVQFYENDAFLIQSLGAFIGAGLGAGEGAVIIATEAHRAALESQLAAQGIDVPAVKSRGQYVSLDAAKTLSQFMIEGVPDEDRFYQVVGSVVARTGKTRPGVRAFGEMVALLWEEGNRDAVVRLEELWNALAKTETFALFCAYPMTAFASASKGDSFAHICKAHSRVIPAESYAAVARTADEQMRSIALLQQQASSLAAEIAERKRVEAELRRRTRELSAFVETAAVGLHWVGPDGIILWANAAELELLGYHADEYIGHHISEFHADKDAIEHILNCLNRGEKLCEYDARLRCKDGAIKNVLIDSNVLWEDGKFIHTQCFTRDATARKRTEQRLAIQYLTSRVLVESQTVQEAASKLLQAICNNAGWDIGAAWLVNDPTAELRCLEVWQNPTAELSEFAEASRERTFKRGIGLPGRVWESGKPAWIYNVTEDSNFPRAPIASKAGLRTAVAFPIRVEKDVVGVVEFFSRETHHEDETFVDMVNAIANYVGQFIERKRAEEGTRRLAAIIEFSDDAIISKDLNGTLNSWNRSAERMFGYTAEEVIGKSVTILIPPELLSEETDILARIRRGEPLQHYETRRRRKDGTLFDVSLTVSPIKDARGNVIGASKIARDISASKQAERALQEAKDRLALANAELETRVRERTASLEEAVSQMEEFSYSVSHDLRAPVRAMQSYAMVLMEDYGERLDENGREFLDRIIRGGMRMDRLIQDVLTYSRLSRRSLELRPLSLDKLVREIVQSYPQLLSSHAQITIQGTLLSVIGHEASLIQAISNLLNNAIKFVSPGTTPKVRLRTERRNGHVRLWVEDNGIGIRPEHQHRLFGMFERIHPEKRYEGTGIGLAIVRKAAERMGGKAGVESDGLTGSNFWIELGAAEQA